MTRYLQIWFAQARYMLTREMMFRSTFLMWIVVDIAWFGLNLAFVEFVFLHTDDIAGWSKWEVVLLFATSNLVQYLFQCLSMTSCMNLPELIRTGKLDYILAQPVDAQFLVSTRNFDVGSLVNAALAVAVMMVAVTQLPEAVSWRGIGLAAILIPFGLLVHYGVMFPLVTLSFWMTKAQGLVTAYYQAFQISRLPREVFPLGFKMFFTFALPLTLVANIPARALLDGVWSPLTAVLVAVSLTLVFLGRVFFKFALRHYASASS